MVFKFKQSTIIDNFHINYYFIVKDKPFFNNYCTINYLHHCYFFLILIVKFFTFKYDNLSFVIKFYANFNISYYTIFKKPMKDLIKNFVSIVTGLNYLFNF